MRRKLLSFLLAFCMVLTLLPASALAAEEDGEQKTETPVAAAEADNEETPAAGTEADSADADDEADSADADAAPAAGESENGLPAASSGSIKLTAGETYKLTANVSGVNFLGIWGSEVADTETTLDLNGYSITANNDSQHGAIYLAAGNLKIINTGSSEGKLVGSGFHTIIVAGAGEKTLTIGKNVTVETASNNYGISIEGAGNQTSNGATVVLDGCKITGQGSGISVNGNITGNSVPKITLQNGASIAVNSHGIYQAGNADVTVGDATITGTTGIEVRAGKLTVNDGAAITATGTWSAAANGNGSTVDGAAIAVSQHTTHQDIDVTVNGGTFTASGTNGTALSIVRPGESATATAVGKNVKVTINGGTFEKCVENRDYAGSELAIKGGTFEVEDAWSLSVMYYTATGGDGATFKLTKGINLYAPVNVMGVATLDLNDQTVGVQSGKTIANAEDGSSAMFQVAGADAKLTITGSGAITAAEGDSYVVTVGSQQNTSGECVFEGDATYTGSVTVAHVFKGTITVKNGTFKLNAEDEAKGCNFMLNIQDANAQDKTGKIVVTGGTFHGFDPAANAADTADATTCYVADGYVSTETAEESGVYLVERDTPVEMEFSELAEDNDSLTDGKIFEKPVTDLGEFTVSTSGDGKNITVTGSARYISNWTQFNSDAAEQEGHYLPINIKLTEGKSSYEDVTITGVNTKTVSGITKADPTIQLVMRLDGIVEAQKNSFTVKYGSNDTCTIDFKDVVLLPQEVEGTRVDLSEDGEAIEAKPATSDGETEDGTKVLIPADASEDLGKMIVEVRAETNVDVPDGTDEKVTSAINGEGSKAVKVTVMLNNAEVFTSASGTQLSEGKEITITIGGLNSGTTYYVFCISNSALTRCGTKQLSSSETTISITTNHLSSWIAVPEPADAEAKAALDTVPEDEGAKVKTTPPVTTEYTVTFDSQGGSAVGPVSVSSGGKITKPVDPTRSGYNFGGWYKESSCTNAWDFGTDTVSGNITLYAKWTYRSSSGGSNGGGGGGGSSSGDTSYTVSVPSRVTGGTVKVSPTSAKKGDTVTITATPGSGYELDKLTVTDSKGDKLALTSKGDGKYTFVMPASRVTVDASFVAVEGAPQISFTDVQPGAYYYDAVVWAAEQGITGGTSATTFSPNNSCTRAQIVTFLWRAAGSPRANASSSFTDVASGSYYYDAVAWAVASGITSGTSATTFSPNATCTRAQAVTFLYRAAGSPAASGDKAFTDVAGGAYYTGAVQWAVNRGVTAGTSATTFSPNDNCTRAQIVTFLYRDRVN